MTRWTLIKLTDQDFECLWGLDPAWWLWGRLLVNPSRPPCYKFHTGSVRGTSVPELAEDNLPKKCAAVNNTYAWPWKPDCAAVKSQSVSYCILTSPSCNKTYRKASLLTKNVWEFSEGKKSGEWTRQKNQRGDRKGESNDSPESPDRGKTSDILGLPSGGTVQK